MWDPRTGREKLVFREHTGNVKSISFSPDGTRIASGGEDGALVWEVATGRVVARLEATIGRVDSLAFTHEGRRVVGGGEGLLCVRDAQTGEEVREPIEEDVWDNSHISVAWAPDGRHVAASCLTGRARLFDLDSGEAVFTTEARSHPRHRQLRSLFPLAQVHRLAMSAV